MINVEAGRVRKKARLDESQDTDIQSTINEMIPYITSKINPAYLQINDFNIQSIINLGATEIITGEFIKEQANEEEEATSLDVGPIRFSENSAVKSRSSRSKDFINSGWEKLKPYLKDEGDIFYFGTMEG